MFFHQILHPHRNIKNRYMCKILSSNHCIIVSIIIVCIQLRKSYINIIYIGLVKWPEWPSLVWLFTMNLSRGILHYYLSELSDLVNNNNNITTNIKALIISNILSIFWSTLLPYLSVSLFSLLYHV